jgi:hypothetical protein
MIILFHFCIKKIVIFKKFDFEKKIKQNKKRFIFAHIIS